MSLFNNPEYNQLKDSIGPFEAAMEMAKQARGIEKSLGNRITTSSALDFAARGELPNPKDYPDHRLDRVKTYIEYITDIEVKSALISSYEESLKYNNLKYLYNTVQDEPRQARIRIIMNILWDSRPHKKGYMYE